MTDRYAIFMKENNIKRSVSPGALSGTTNLFLFLLALICIPVSLARAQNTLAERQAIVTGLNNGLSYFYTTTGTQILAPDGASTLLSDISGSCFQLQPNSKTLYDYGSNWGIKVLMQPARRINILPESHRMVCDLNNIWLYRSWGFLVADSLGSHKFGDSVSCMLGPSQPYYMTGIRGVNAWVNKSIRDSLLARGMGEWFLMNSSYTTADYSGTEAVRTKPFSFIRVDDPSNGVDNENISFIAKYRTGTGQPHDLAKLAYTKITFHDPFPVSAQHPYPDNNSLVQLTSVEMKAVTHKYTPTDCSYLITGEPAPGTNGASITITFTLVDRGTSAVTTHSCTRSFNSGTVTENNALLWQTFDQNNDYIIRNWCEFAIDTMGYLTFRVKDPNSCTGAGTYRIMQLRNPNIPAEYCESTFPPDGLFYLDPATGEIVYRTCSNCPPVSVPCLQLCGQIASSEYETMEGVVAASVQTFSNRWAFDSAGFLPSAVSPVWGQGNNSNNSIESGFVGKWRPEGTFVYKTNIKPGGKISSNERNYADAGVFVDNSGSTAAAFRMFNWESKASNAGTKWLQVDSITLFSPYGEPLEQRDILGMYSAASFSHQNSVPKLVAKNAMYSTVGFQSFEDGAGTVKDTAHSGKWSYRLPQSGWSAGIFPIIVNQHLWEKGLELKVWVKRTYHDIADGEVPVAVDIDADGTSDNGFVQVAQTGEWSLYQRRCGLSNYNVNDTILIRFSNVLAQPVDPAQHDSVWIDDPRAQPFDAEMACYVYDAATLRLITQFDDQHFGVYYQYNGEGKLIRMMRETERGMKTVTDAQYNTPQLAYRTDAEGGGASPMLRREFGRSSRNNSVFGMEADRAASTSAGAGSPEGFGANVDMLDLELGAEGPKVKVLGMENPDLSLPHNIAVPDLDFSGIGTVAALDTARLNALMRDMPDIADSSRIAMLYEFHRLQEQLATLESRKREATDEAVQEAIDAEMVELGRTRDTLLREKLGLSESEVRELYKTIDSDAAEPRDAE